MYSRVPIPEQQSSAKPCGALLPKRGSPSPATQPSPREKDEPKEKKQERRKERQRRKTVYGEGGRGGLSSSISSFPPFHFHTSFLRLHSSCGRGGLSPSAKPSRREGRTAPRMWLVRRLTSRRRLGPWGVSTRTVLRCLSTHPRPEAGNACPSPTTSARPMGAHRFRHKGGFRMAACPREAGSTCPQEPLAHGEAPCAASCFFLELVVPPRVNVFGDLVHDPLSPRLVRHLCHVREACSRIYSSVPRPL